MERRWLNEFAAMLCVAVRGSAGQCVAGHVKHTAENLQAPQKFGLALLCEAELVNAVHGRANHAAA